MEQETESVKREISKEIATVQALTWEVDRLSHMARTFEVFVNGDMEVAVEEADMTASLLMRLLLKFNGIKAEGKSRAGALMFADYGICCVHVFDDMDIKNQVSDHQFLISTEDEFSWTVLL
ncbi:unnamed protein product [Brassica oleracea var. botrytis]